MPNRSTPPSNAEKHILSDFIHIGRKPSKFVKKVMVDDPEKSYLECPACEKHLSVPAHGERLACDCGLKMQAAGNGLSIWKQGT